MASTKTYPDPIDQHQLLTNKVIALLEQVVQEKWIKPWFTFNRAPFNPVSGTRYRGINAISLGMAGFQDPRWYTFKQLLDLSKQTGKEYSLKGQKGTPIFKALDIVTEDKNKPLQDNGDPALKKFMVMKYLAHVFNGSQIAGLELYVEQKLAFEPIDAVEDLQAALIKRTNLKVKFGSTGAYYDKMNHVVSMPAKESFRSVMAYYDTLLHEFGHSTGPALNRKMTGTFGTQDYAYEELCAELCSVFMAAELGVSHDQNNHAQSAAYIGSWLKALKGDKNFIFKAAGAASKAAAYQMDHLMQYVEEREQQIVLGTDVIKTIEERTTGESSAMRPPSQIIVPSHMNM